MINAIAAFFGLLGTQDPGSKNFSTYCVHDWDYITAEHVRGVLRAHGLSYGPATHDFGNALYPVNVATEVLTRYLRDEAPPERFSIYMSGIRDFSDQDGAQWPIIRKQDWKSARIGPTTFTKFLTGIRIPLDEVRSVRCLEIRYLTDKKRWRTGADVEVITKKDRRITYQVYTGAKGTVVLEIHPIRGNHNIDIRLRLRSFDQS
jgi:hypothetical protein